MDLAGMIGALEARVEVLEAGRSPSPDAYPAYVPGQIYRIGSTVTYQGKQYRCIAPEGSICTWSPEDYPAYWEPLT